MHRCMAGTTSCLHCATAPGTCTCCAYGSAFACDYGPFPQTPPYGTCKQSPCASSAQNATYPLNCGGYFAQCCKDSDCGTAADNAACVGGCCAYGGCLTRCCTQSISSASNACKVCGTRTTNGLHPDVFCRDPNYANNCASCASGGTAALCGSGYCCDANSPGSPSDLSCTKNTTAGTAPGAGNYQCLNSNNGTLSAGDPCCQSSECRQIPGGTPFTCAGGFCSESQVACGTSTTNSGGFGNFSYTIAIGTGGGDFRFDYNARVEPDRFIVSDASKNVLFNILGGCARNGSAPGCSGDTTPVGTCVKTSNGNTCPNCSGGDSCTAAGCLGNGQGNGHVYLSRPPALLVCSAAAQSEKQAAQQGLFGTRTGDVDELSKFLSSSLEDMFSHLFQQDGQARRRALRTTQGLESVQQFFSDMLGGNWTSFLPQSWSLPSFSWDSLGTFEYQSNMQARQGRGIGLNLSEEHREAATPRRSAIPCSPAPLHSAHLQPSSHPLLPGLRPPLQQDFLDNADLSRPTSVQDLADKLAHVESHFCTPEIFNASTLMPASCTGPTVTLAFLPKVCTLDSANKAVICDPAKLVLQKTPGSCVHAYHSAATWKGKECAIKGHAGFTKANVHGGSEYHIPLHDLHLGDYTP
eukprot:scaffold2.g7038.t1